MSTSSYSSHSVESFTDEPSAPVLLHSSDELGWSELRVREYIEPPSEELWPSPVAPVLTLRLLVRGTAYLEVRPLKGAWQGKVVQQGSLFIQPKYLQAYETRWRSCSPTPLNAVYIHVPQAVLFRVIEETADRDPAHFTFTEQLGFHDPLLLQLGYTLQQELKQPAPVGALYAQTAAQLIAVHLLRYYSTANVRVSEPTQGLTKRQLRHIHDFIQAHLEHNLSLAVLAQQVELSPYYFARLFHLATGESPHQFVLRQRLERAQWLLQTTKIPIVDIALQCGFANQSYLTTVFKRRLGLTPQRYRRQVL